MILTLIKTLTASNDASLSFVDGTASVVLDNTYAEYMFVWTDVGPATDDVIFTFQGSKDAGSNYNLTATTACFRSHHDEADSTTGLAYDASQDRAQQTTFIPVTAGGLGNGADESSNGILHLFNPSSTTYNTNFMSRSTIYHASNYIYEFYMGGYFNDTDDVDAVQFKMSSGNFDGVIQLYGIA